MSTLYFDETTPFSEALKRIRQAAEDVGEVKFARGSVFWQNLLNRVLLLGVISRLGKKIELTLPPSSEIEASPAGMPTATSGDANRSKSFHRVRWWLLGLAAFVVLFLVGGVAFIFIYLPKAEVVLKVEERILENESLVTIDPEMVDLEPEALRLPGKLLRIDEQATEVFAATGTEEVGEQAVGQVTLRNWTDEELSLAAGAKVRTRTDPVLGFALVEAVTVPAQEIMGEQLDERTYVAGKATVQVKADDIGEEYNLATAQELEVGGLSFANLAGVNEAAFSGGSRRQAAVISEDDQARARKQLLAKLTTQAQTDLESKLLGDQRIIRETVKNQVVGETFDHPVGDEAGQFHLTLKVQMTAVAYSQSQLEGILEQSLLDSVPEGFVLSGTDRTVSAQSVVENDEGGYRLSAAIKALVIPAIDLEKLKQELAGNKLEQAQSILSQVPNLKEYQINLWPRLPAPLQVLPYRRERIQINIQAT